MVDGWIVRTSKRNVLTTCTTREEALKFIFSLYFTDGSGFEDECVTLKTWKNGFRVNGGPKGRMLVECFKNDEEHWLRD